jgi:hypothetical protein
MSCLKRCITICRSRVCCRFESFSADLKQLEKGGVDEIEDILSTSDSLHVFNMLIVIFALDFEQTVSRCCSNR